MPVSVANVGAEVAAASALSARPGLTAERRTSEVNGRPVIEVQVRTRPQWLRCALAPHSAEVSILRPESRYHRLVFTVREWDAFLADVKAGLYDVVEASCLSAGVETDVAGGIGCET